MQGKELLRQLCERQGPFLPGFLGFTIEYAGENAAKGYFEVQEHHLNPNGYLHAGSVVAFADTACGYGCWAFKPEGAVSFTTMEIKSNFIGTAREGIVTVDARLVHGGRTTQLWDAEVKNADGKVIAHFRCTQLLIYPKEKPK